MTEENECILNIKASGPIDKEIEIGFVGKFSVNQNMPLADALRNTVDDFNQLMKKLRLVTVDDVSISDIAPVEIKVDGIMLSKHDTDVVLNGHPFTVEPEHPDSFDESEDYLPEEPEESILSYETLEKMSRSELLNHARKIIIDKILTWDCIDVQDLANIISKEILPIDDALNSSEALDMLINITPPSAINVKNVKSLFPDNEEIAAIWTIDKYNKCYFVGTGHIGTLYYYLSEK